ncbi:MAG: hypothetical protein ABR549_06220 [Mycobacteriales bacterium]
MNRWDAPWTAPTGAAPERPPGEPGYGVLALVHLGVLFALSALGSLTQLATGDTQTVTAFVLTAVVGVGGWALWSQGRDPLRDWLSDLIIAASAAYLFGAVALLAHDQGASDARATLVGAGVALPYALLGYALHRRVWLQLATVAAAAGTLLSALAQRPEVPHPTYAAFLLVLAGFLALLSMSGIARPVRSGYVLAAVLATTGAQVLIDADTVAGSAVSVLVLGAVVVGVVLSGNRSLLPVTLVALVVLGPQLLAPAVGGWRAAGLSFAATGAMVGWLAVDLARRAVRPVHVGGVMAACLVLVLLSLPFQLAHGRHDTVAAVLHALALIAFFGAAAAARRRPATVISAVLVVLRVPHAFGGSSNLANGLIGLVAVVAVVLIAVRLDKRHPAASPWYQEQALTGPGADWTLPVPYQQAFDAVVAELAGAGLVLQLVDRAGGRVVAGDAAVPWLTVAVWATDPVQAHVRAVGPLPNVTHLREQLGNRLAAPH